VYKVFIEYHSIRLRKFIPGHFDRGFFLFPRLDIPRVFRIPGRSMCRSPGCRCGAATSSGCSRRRPCGVPCGSAGPDDPGYSGSFFSGLAARADAICGVPTVPRSCRCRNSRHNRQEAGKGFRGKGTVCQPAPLMHRRSPIEFPRPNNSCSVAVFPAVRPDHNG
jgi:hypothetical protein